MILEHREDMIVAVVVILGSDERMQSFTVAAPSAIIRIIVLLVDGGDEFGLSI